MKKTVAAFLLCVFIFACKRTAIISVPVEEISNPAAAQALLATTRGPLSIAGKAYFFGDSITQGYDGTTFFADNWVVLLSSFVGWTYINAGIGGTTMEKNAGGKPEENSMFARSLTEIPTKKDGDKYLFFAYGMNDVWQNRDDQTPDHFIADYQFVLNNAIALGWQPKDIVLVNIYYCNEAHLLKITNSADGRFASFNKAVKTVADKNATRFVDINTFMKNNGGQYLLLPDGIHPNATGYAVIERGIEQQLRKW